MNSLEVSLKPLNHYIQEDQYIIMMMHLNSSSNIIHIQLSLLTLHQFQIFLCMTSQQEQLHMWNKEPINLIITIISMMIHKTIISMKTLDQKLMSIDSISHLVTMLRMKDQLKRLYSSMIYQLTVTLYILLHNHLILFCSHTMKKNTDS